MKHFIVGCLVLVSCAAASTAEAVTVSLDSYRNPTSPDFKAFNTLYLDGVKEGLIAYSVVQKQSGETPLFCVPPQLAITVEQAENILMRYANKRKMPGSGPINMILLGGLMDTFPCETK